jgi:UDP-N-acetyl-D-mannosaminuronic acid transferase (WecB/TagA/CpsF family)
MRILGIEFFEGTDQEAVDQLWKGGLAVAPSGPGLAKDLLEKPSYRQAVRNAALVVPDSGAMVLVWNFLHGIRGKALRRFSGLAFLRAILADDRIRERRTFWVMPSSEESEVNIRWLAQEGIEIPEDYTYIAPVYRPNAGRCGEVADPDLLTAIERSRPDLVILNVGGGIQEPLGGWLSANLSYKPGILCTGAALAFLTGKQSSIPPWADRYYLGWLLRTMGDPKRFAIRYWEALRLLPLVARYGSEMPPLSKLAAQESPA